MSTSIHWTDDAGATVALELDVAKVLTYERTAEASEHPVESGPPIADHIKLTAGQFTMEAVVSNTPVRIPTTHTRGLTRASAAVDLRVGDQIERVQLQQWSGTLDRKRACHDELRALIARRRLIVLTTPLETIENLALVRVQVTEDESSGNALKVALGFSQVRVAGTARAPVPAIPRAQARAERGPQQPPDDRSLAARGADRNAPPTPEQRAQARERQRIAAQTGSAGL